MELFIALSEVLWDRGSGLAAAAELTGLRYGFSTLGEADIGSERASPTAVAGDWGPM